MSLIRTRTAEGSSVVGDVLRRELSRELAVTPVPDAPIRQPLVLEDETEGTRQLNVTVIWERWKLASPGERISIVRDAYGSVRPQDAERLLIITPVSTTEAIDLGLLPYEIDFDESGMHEQDVDAVASAMAEEGAVWPRVGLHLPDLPSAQIALGRLQQQFPGVAFRIKERKGA